MTNKAEYLATIRGIEEQREHGVNYSGCSGRLFQLGACPSEWGAAGITPQQVKQSMIGAAWVLASAVPVGGIIDLIGAAGRTAAETAPAAEEVGVVFRSDTSHIFRGATGHLAQDTAENRALIQGVVSPGNLRSTITLPDGSTLAKYFETLPDGTQAWAEVRNGTEITNGGLNATPR